MNEHSSGPPGRDRAQAPPARSPSWVVPWPTVIFMAVVMTYANGFWMVSLRGAIGPSIGPEGPFLRWLVDSTLMLPIVLVGVLAAYARAHRRYGEVLHGARAVLGTAVLVALAGSVVGVAGLVVSAGWEYHEQAQRVEMAHVAHSATTGPAGGCSEVCETQKRALASLHVRGVRDAGAVALLGNLLLVGWVVALRGGEVDGDERERGMGPR